jgi:cyclic-di-GMP-binding protein
MPSFDIVSEVDMHEAANAVDQSNREVGTRFDFKGVDASFELTDKEVVLNAQTDFHIQQMMDILKAKAAKRGLDVASLKPGEVELVGQRATLRCTIQQGIESEIARKIVKHVKDLKMKVQIAIQGDKLRVTGKKRDDLQDVIAVLRDGDWGLPLQFNNFRD